VELSLDTQHRLWETAHVRKTRNSMAPNFKFKICNFDRKRTPETKPFPPIRHYQFRLTT
jgi:hypothetical protein